MKRILFSLLFTFPILGFAQDNVVLFSNVRIFNAREGKVTSGNVLVVGNLIKTVSAAPIPTDRSARTRIVEGNGRFLMPGLIDNHTHLSINTASQEVLLTLSAAGIDSLTREEGKKMLLRGFTTIRDLGGPVFTVKKEFDKNIFPGPRIYPSGAMVSQTSGHGDNRMPNEKSKHYGGEVSKGELMGMNFIADGVPEVLNAVRENLRSGATQIKVMAGGGAATLYDPLDVTQYTFEEIKAAVDAAADWGTYVCVHAYTPRAVRRSLDAGVKVIEHGQLLDDATMKYLAGKGAFLSLQSLDPAPPQAAEVVKIKKQKVVDGTDLAFRLAKKYKVKLLWGTDYLFDPKTGPKQSTDILKLQKWFTNAEVLRLLTYDNSQVFKLSGERNPYQAGRLGVIEEGAYADLILVDGDPVKDLQLMADPGKNFLLIMKDGVLYKDALAK
jgi:imidazolonepropionase-like amidohydrolase